MTEVLLLGAGNIGVAIADLLSASGDCDVTVGDCNESRLAETPEPTHTKHRQEDVSLADFLESRFGRHYGLSG